MQLARLKVDSGVQVYCCDPQYLPKRNDLSGHSTDTLAAVAGAIIGRPRKTLGRKTLAEVPDQCLAQIENHALRRPIEVALAALIRVVQQGVGES